MSSSGYTETVDLSMNRIYAGNLEPRMKSLEDFDTAQSVINNSVIRTNVCIKMTFSHDMARLFFVEQMYRAFSILNNDPYHHE